MLPPGRDIEAGTGRLDQLFDALAKRHSSDWRVPRMNDGTGAVNSLRRRLYRVLHEHVFIRGQPKVEGKVLGVRKSGDLLVVMDVRGDGWVQLDASELKKLPRACSAAFMLVDGKAVGLGALLEDTQQITHVQIITDGVPPQLAPPVSCVEQGLYPP